MKKFISKLCIAFVGGVIFISFVWIYRILSSQSIVRDVYSLDQQTKIIFIGNSHTGKSWKENAAYRNKVLWRSSECFLFSEMRLAELERRNQLGNIEVCVMNFDGPSMTFFNDDKICQDVLSEAPVAIHHLDIFPTSLIRLFVAALESANVSFCIQEQNPEPTKNWISRTNEEKSAHLKRVYECFPSDWSATYYTKNWEELLIGSVERVRAICNRNGIRLIFFAAPLVKDNPELVDVKRYEKIDSMIQRVKNMGIEFYDLRRFCPDSQFMDSHHLHDEGAGELTRHFLSTILGLL